MVDRVRVGKEEQLDMRDLCIFFAARNYKLMNPKVNRPLREASSVPNTRKQFYPCPPKSAKPPALPRRKVLRSEEYEEIPTFTNDKQERRKSSKVLPAMTHRPVPDIDDAPLPEVTVGPTNTLGFSMIIPPISSPDSSPNNSVSEDIPSTKGHYPLHLQTSSSKP